MDDRTLGAAVGGALLIASSAARVQRAAERSIRVRVMRDLGRHRHSLWRRMTNAGALVGGSIGFVLLLYAVRRQRIDERGRAQSTSPDEDGAAA